MLRMIYREGRVRVRRHAPTNRVSFFTLCLLGVHREISAKTEEINPRAAAFPTGSLHVPRPEFHAERGAVVSSPSFSFLFFFFFFFFFFVTPFREDRGQIKKDMTLTAR